MRLSVILALSLALGEAAFAEASYPTDIKFEDGAVAQSLTGTPGDPANGKILMNKGAGNCIACHQVSALSELPFHGEIGPMLDGAAGRWTEADLRGSLNNDSLSEDEIRQIEEDRAKAQATAELREEDYQLAYAIDILKGLSAFNPNGPSQ